jgi:hypothetical protein
MASTETLLFPGIDYSSEALQPQEPSLEAFGDVALRGAEAIIDQAYIDEGLALLNAQANSIESVRPEDAGRTHDIEAAFDAALQEDEIFNAHREALLENAARSLVAQEVDKPKSEDDTAEPVRVAVDAAANNGQSQAPKAEESSHRKQAELALKDAGYEAIIPFESQVTVDPATGNLAIANGSNVRVLERQASGAILVRDYSFDEDTGTITISGPNTSPVQAREFVASNKEEEQRLSSRVVSLPPAVAKVAHFSNAVAVRV